MNFLRKFLSHPRTQLTRRIVRRTLAIASVILAVAFVTTLTMDLGPLLRERAERAGSNYLKRSMHIGSLGVRLWNGAYVVDDFVIDGLTPQSRPWLTAKRIMVYMPWRTLLNRQIVFDSIVMSDWNMYVEQLADGTHSFPNFPRTSGGERRWTTTLKYVRAERGEFTYEDRGTPWSVITRNLDVTVAKPNSEYRGSARFSNGLVSIQDYVPFRADMNTTFKIDKGRVLFDAIHLTTDGTKSELKGDVDLSHWPEQMYSVKSTIDLPRMRQLFFAKDKFELGGTADFEGYFHLFKGEVGPDGKTASGRELKGNFRTGTMMVNDYRFDDVAGYVRWIPRALEVHDATARLYGGRANFEYSMAPLGVRGTKPSNTFDADYAGVELTVLSDFFGLRGLRLAGRATGHNLLRWPSGQFARRDWTGEVRVDPPAGTTLMTRQMPVEELRTRSPRNQRPGEFSSHLPKGPVPIGGTLTYSLGPLWIDIGPSKIATPTTYIEVGGRTAYGDDSRMPFHVSSSDWQDSDRLFAGLLTAFGNETKAIPVDGYGTFDGVMLGAFRRPRIEGTFDGHDIRAFDTTWGSVAGEAVIENSYADVTNIVVTQPDTGSTMNVAGRFSLGYPRRDGGEQINARIQIKDRPIADLKHAFDIEDYDVDGTFSGDFQVTGEYERPFGSGTMQITNGVAYGEKFDLATADTSLEGDGVRLANIVMKKGAGSGIGSASITWQGTYSFNFDASNIAIETLTVMEGSTLPLSGMINFKATGNSTFDHPRYSVHGTISDFFIADEGIGDVIGDLSVDNDLLTVGQVNAASARLVVSGDGTIRLNDTRDTNLRFTVTDTSLDPYIRAFEPRLSPYTTAIASGTVHVQGELANIDNVLVDVNVDRFDVRLFDFPVRNPDDPKRPGYRIPIRLALDRHSVRIVDMRLAGVDTTLSIGGNVDLHNETIAMRFDGEANLQILEGFTRNVRSTGRAKVGASLQGAMRDPVLNGEMAVAGGRIRHFGLPHALDDINGVITFDSRGVNLDGLSAEIGRGPVTFGGTIGIENYGVGPVEVTVAGEDMHLRYPQSSDAWLTATVDAMLGLRGTAEAMTLSGDVMVHDALYSKNFTAGGNLFDFSQPAAAVTSSSSFVTTTLPLSYDVQITAPSTVRIQNSLIQRGTQARVDVRLRGTYARPVLLGNVDIERGDVIFEGRRYQIRRASIQFNNSIQPFFDLEAGTRIRVPGETYNVTVTSSGFDPVNAIRFSSDPELGDYELLALVFGDVAPGGNVEFRQYAGVTPQEQLLRERIGRALTAPVSSEISRAFQQALDVEAVQLTASIFDPNVQSARLDPAARVTILKRVNNRVYLTYSRSLSSSTRDQVILLEFDQTDQLSWILSRNEDGTYAFDMRVRRTF